MNKLKNKLTNNMKIFNKLSLILNKFRSDIFLIFIY